MLGNRYYEVKPIFTTKMAPGFTMLDKEFGKQSKHSILVSLPMYCYFSNLMIEEVPFERLFIKLRDPNNKE